ncbi:MAG: putative homogentisate 1,2-dioxygenase [Frankiales bacterium]|nr:putative homogentisate 1,2-dioxygenase [Frankiales bacterium]
MPHYKSVGDVPRKRHVQFRQPDGRLYAEELMGEEGFSSDSALLYHRELPTRLVNAVGVGSDDAGLTPPEVLLPRHLMTGKLPVGSSLVDGRTVLMGNANVRISYAAAEVDSALYRDSDGDLLVYVESGSGRLDSVFGSLDVGAGDYVVVPTGTTHRWVVVEGPLRCLLIEARGHVTPPKQYLSARGQLLEHAPFCERDFRSPSEPLLEEAGETDVLVRRRGQLTRYTYASHPFDVVGWDGCLYPYALSIHDFEPVTGRLHQPPPVHQTFAGPGFVICSFVPRLLDYHPDAVPVPYNHSNVDSDEVLFYVGGDFTSRAGSGVTQGSITLHPGGFVHGPQPGSVERALGKGSTDEMAVMIDTFAPLDLAPGIAEIDDPGYPWTWAR